MNRFELEDVEKILTKKGFSFSVVAAKLFVEKYCNLGEKLENLVAIKVHFLFFFNPSLKKNLLV